MNKGCSRKLTIVNTDYFDVITLPLTLTLIQQQSFEPPENNVEEINAEKKVPSRKRR